MLSSKVIENIIREAESSPYPNQRTRAIGCLEGIILDRGLIGTGMPVPDETRDFFKHNWLGKPTKKVVQVKLTFAMFVLEQAKLKLLR